MNRDSMEFFSDFNCVALEEAFIEDIAFEYLSVFNEFISNLCNISICSAQKQQKLDSL